MIEPLGISTRAGFYAREGRVAAKPDPAFYHEPVLLQETVEALAPTPGKVILDGTLGGGGHSEALLSAGAQVIGIDQDPEALEFARKRLSRFPETFIPLYGNFSEAPNALAQLGITKLDGALLDLGISSHQLDTAERGFSFMQEGPLDMRMDPANPHSAADLLNYSEPEQLEKILRIYGEEPQARRITNEIIRTRGSKPFSTTLDLALCVERVVPRHGRTHPATRTFQALRIAVNRELEVLETALPAIADMLSPGARFAVISFHSLEDRIVKYFFRERCMATIDRPEWPAPRPNPLHIFKPITTRPLVASEEEQDRNPRSRSAKLRVVERL